MFRRISIFLLLSYSAIEGVLGLFEHAQHPVAEMRVGEALVGEVLRYEPVALFEEFGLGMVFGITVGYTCLYK